MKKNDSTIQIGNVLRKILEDKKISQAELANKLGLSKQSISQLLNQKSISTKTLQNVCLNIGCSLSEFFGDLGDQEKIMMLDFFKNSHDKKYIFHDYIKKIFISNLKSLKFWETLSEKLTDEIFELIWLSKIDRGSESLLEIKNNLESYYAMLKFKSYDDINEIKNLIRDLREIGLDGFTILPFHSNILNNLNLTFIEKVFNDPLFIFLLKKDVITYPELSFCLFDFHL